MARQLILKFSNYTVYSENTGSQEVFTISRPINCSWSSKRDLWWKFTYEILTAKYDEENIIPYDVKFKSIDSNTSSPFPFEELKRILLFNEIIKKFQA